MEATGFMEFFRPAGIPLAALILLITILLARLVTRTSRQLGERFPDKRLVIQQVGSFVRFFLYLIGGLGAAATVLKLEPEVLLALGGTAAVSIGIALKDVVASLVAGLVILVDRPFQVGDRVTFGEYYGEIRDIGLRSVRLVTLDDTLVTIPNNKLLTDVVASGNAGAVEMMIQTDFWIGIDQDVAQARKLVQECLTTSRYIHHQRTWNVFVTQQLQGDIPAVRLRAKAYVLDVRFEKAFESDVHERVLAAFAEAEIRPPAILHRSLDEPAATAVP